ncbi:hypothetical protein [Nonomuraea sp. NPDC050643]|uniref:hypothetical protein n=1 Tax=Nonomuraea sp. NPDC050643 TaxID=3155660 RepID=UPI0033E3F50C
MTRPTRRIPNDRRALNDRRDDQLLLLEEVCELTRREPATERWLRHQKRAPYLWRSGRRLVAWRSDVIAHLAAEQEADQQKSA